MEQKYIDYYMMRREASDYEWKLENFNSKEQWRRESFGFADNVERERLEQSYNKYKALPPLEKSALEYGILRNVLPVSITTEGMEALRNYVNEMAEEMSNEDDELDIFKYNPIFYNPKYSDHGPQAFGPEGFDDAMMEVGTTFDIVDEGVTYTFKTIDQHGGEGEGDEFWYIVKVTDDRDEGESYFKFDGWYASYQGWAIEGVMRVFPHQVMITKWETEPQK